MEGIPFELFKLDPGIFERVLSFLSLDELLLLRETCGWLNLRVKEYVRHLVSARKIRKKSSEFLNKCEELLLCREKRIFESLKEEPDLEDFLLLKYENVFMEKCYRISVLNAHDFPHFKNPQYIIPVMNQHLGREYVKLLNVCWLYFMVIFPDVPPGNYKCSIHMRIARHSYFYESDLTITLKLPGGSPPLSSSSFSMDDLNSWSKDSERLSLDYIKETPPCETCNDYLSSNYSSDVSSDDSEVEIVDRNYNWFFLHLPTFSLKEKRDLEFVFRDTTGFWKSGIEWDFVQLLKIN